MEYFNNKNLKKIGQGSFGSVYTNGRYAYKFIVSEDRDKLERERRMFTRASNIGIAPPIPLGKEAVIKSIGNGKYVMRIGMKRLNGKVTEYAKMMGGIDTYKEIASLAGQLHLNGICHGDLFGLGNIVHDGKRLYIIDFSEASKYNKKTCNDQNGISSLQRILSKIQKRKSPETSQKRRRGLSPNSPVRGGRALSYGSPGTNMGSPKPPRAPRKTVKRRL